MQLIESVAQYRKLLEIRRRRGSPAQPCPALPFPLLLLLLHPLPFVYPKIRANISVSIWESHTHTHTTTTTTTTPPSLFLSLSLPLFLSSSLPLFLRASPVTWLYSVNYGLPYLHGSDSKSRAKLVLRSVTFLITGNNHTTEFNIYL